MECTGYNTTFFKAGATSYVGGSYNGRVNVRGCRPETRDVYTVVDATHGRFVIEDFSSTAGNTTANISGSTMCNLYRAAEVHFKNSALPTNLKLQVLGVDEAITIKGGQTHNIDMVLENCVLSGTPIYSFVDTSGIARTFRDVLSGNSVTPIIRSIKSRQDWWFGINDYMSYYDTYTKWCVTNTRASGGNIYFILSGAGVTTTLPPYSFIESIKVYKRAGVSGASTIGVHFAGDSTPIATATISETGYEKVELLSGTSIWGISVPFNTGVSPLQMTFTVRSPTDWVIPTATIIGRTDIIFKPIQSMSEISAGDYVSFK